MAKVRIAYLIDSIVSDKAGTEKQLLGILKRLDRAQFEPVLVCLTSSSWLEQASLPCPLIVLGYKGFAKPDILSVVKRLARLLDEKRIDILQTFFEDASLVGWLGKKVSRRKPLLLCSRRDLGLGDEPWYHGLYKLVWPWVYRGFDGFVVNANAIENFLVKKYGVSSERVQLIRNGLDLGRIEHAIPYPISEFPEAFWVGIVANLKPVKRIDVFLDGFARAAKQCPQIDMRSVILGDGPLITSLKAFAETLGVTDKVYFMGSVDNVSDYLGHLNLGVLCSDREGLSNAILEYMAHGLPIIATRVGGNCELVDDINGIVVPPGDGGQLGDALVELIQSPQRTAQLGEGSLAKLKEGFVWEENIKQWSSYYLGLARTRRPA